MIQNKDGGALHVNRSDGSIRLPDAKKLDRGQLFENIPRPESRKPNYVSELKRFRRFPKSQDSLSVVD